jgi:hypothetical protein
MAKRGASEAKLVKVARSLHGLGREGNRAALEGRSGRDGK